MTTANAPRGSLTTEKGRSSPPVSSASSAVSSSTSAESRPGQNGIIVPSIEHLNVNGTAAPPSDLQIAVAGAAVEKPSMTKRLTRMFSTKDAMRSETSINSQSTNGVSSPKKLDTTTPSNNSPKPNPPSRKASSTDKTSKPEPKPTMAIPKDKKGAAGISSQRYVTNSELPGGHEHHLKSARRQEKLSDMFRNVISGRQRNAEHPHEGEQQLSLMSGWYGKCQEIVGRGAFGIVRISHKRTEAAGEQLYAVKEFRRRPEENEKKYSKRLTSEFCISSSLRHPNVIHTLDLLQDSKGDYCEVMEFCAGGDLYTLVLAAGKLEVAEADCYFKQMMRGVEYMHEMGVAHRDLKPENLLLTTHGSLKITDFGNGECFRMAWEADAHMVSGLCGSAPYIAPEEYIDKEFDARAVDVWATGVIYMAMRTGRHLWRVAKKEEDEFYERYLQGRRDEEGYGPIESLHRARCRNVIYSILDPNPGRRITASQVLKSEWGREIKLCKAGEEGL
ncbi:Serine/threonine-protein kinase [Lachnellula subtilissima]|uniref:non-specific serine/threonine protein kinase n=1 Tax=Lachnellula subtilissima TaxID=602034 RepID=A0A8H8RVA1_9HELO|nr:Serine/threonine-protein kinase [Lachnellula subtilissima]